MSSIIKTYRIHYDGNDGYIYHERLYCKYNNSLDTQKWIYSSGQPVTFECMTDSQAKVISCCIAQIPTNDKHFYWEELNESIPDIIKNILNYYNY